MPRPTGSEHFTRYFIRAFAACGSAANHCLKWSSLSEVGFSPFTPSRFGDIPFIMPHEFASIVPEVEVTVGATDVVVVVSPVHGSVVVVVVVVRPVLGSAAAVVVTVAPVSGSVEVVVV